MQTPINAFKKAMQEGRPQIGLWVGLADGYAAEILAGVGYDWLLLDGEHAPNDVRSVLAQLQAVSSAWAALPHRSQPIVRLPVGETALIKQYLDIGAQTLLIPMVDTAEQAAQLAQALRENGIAVDSPTGCPPVTVHGAAPKAMPRNRSVPERPVTRINSPIR